MNYQTDKPEPRWRIDIVNGIEVYWLELHAPNLAQALESVMCEHEDLLHATNVTLVARVVK